MSGSAIVITADMLKPVIDAVSTNAGVILPVGLAIMAIFIGIGMIPRLIYKFL